MRVAPMPIFLYADAANLGDDADTTAAVCGQVAGTYTVAFPFSSSPLHGRQEDLRAVAGGFVAGWQGGRHI